jgi:hypothetical protein
VGFENLSMVYVWVGAAWWPTGGSYNRPTGVLALLMTNDYKKERVSLYYRAALCYYWIVQFRTANGKDT